MTALRFDVEVGPWFPMQLGATWVAMHRDWERAQRPPIAFLMGEREATAVAMALNELWQIEAGRSPE